MHGTGMNTRNFLFVEDVARAFDVVLHKGEIGNVYNIGGTNEFANIEVARKLLKEMGKVRDDSADALAEAESELITWAPDRPFNDGTRC
jgi:dTDP-D-glucose 4,6-dehydratase